MDVHSHLLLTGPQCSLLRDLLIGRSRFTATLTGGPYQAGPTVQPQTYIFSLVLLLRRLFGPICYGPPW